MEKRLRRSLKRYDRCSHACRFVTELNYTILSGLVQKILSSDEVGHLRSGIIGIILAGIDLTHACGKTVTVCNLPAHCSDTVGSKKNILYSQQGIIGQEIKQRNLLDSCSAVNIGHNHNALFLVS